MAGEYTGMGQPYGQMYGMPQFNPYSAYNQPIGVPFTYQQMPQSTPTVQNIRFINPVLWYVRLICSL